MEWWLRRPEEVETVEVPEVLSHLGGGGLHIGTG